MLKTIVRLHKCKVAEHASWQNCVTKHQSGLTYSRLARLLSSSSEAAEKSAIEETHTQSQDVERLLKKSTKRKKNVPFVKELFLGRFNKVFMILLSLHNERDKTYLKTLSFVTR